MEHPKYYQNLLLCFSGVFFSYLVFGYFQEKITKQKYNNEKFSEFYMLMLLQSVFNTIWGYFEAKIYSHDLNKNKVSQMMYFLCGSTYLFAMLSSITALSWISYPCQVIGKSVKPIPVMLLGVFFGRKRYNFSKYINVLIITLGVVMFMYSEDKKSKSNDNGNMMGNLLLIVSLIFDGLTGAIQERMRSSNPIVATHLMLFLNLWSAIILIPICLFTNQFSLFYRFASNNPRLLKDIFLLSVSSAVGQSFIFRTISTLGPLMCSIITTTRKFFTIMLSVIFFGNSLSFRQWIGAFLVFTGITLDSMKPKIH